MAIVEVRSALTHRSLVKRSKADLRNKLDIVARHPGLSADALAGAIMFLADRIPVEKSES